MFLLKDPATTKISTLSLHDALPICRTPPAGEGRRRGGPHRRGRPHRRRRPCHGAGGLGDAGQDRKSTRLNSSHTVISYAVFCLKKKNNYYEYVFLIALLLSPKTRLT